MNGLGPVNAFDNSIAVATAKCKRPAVDYVALRP
jgi:hypothetical protein